MAAEATGSTGRRGMPARLRGLVWGVLSIGALAGALPAVACSVAGLNGVYLWPMKVSSGAQSCQVSVHLLFDGKGHGWMQPVDASCPRPGVNAQASVFRYTIDDECSGQLIDRHGRYQVELENDDVEITLARGAWRVGGVATRQRPLEPGELSLIEQKAGVRAVVDRSVSR